MQAFADQTFVSRPASYARTLLLVGLTSVTTAPLSAAAQPAPDLSGVWEVEHLSNDTQATRKLTLEQDDPRMVGRFLDVRRDRVLFSLSDGDLACGSPSFMGEQTTAGALIAHTMGGRGYPPVTPKPEDYKFPLATDTPVQVLWLSCTSGGIGPGFGGRRDAWFVGLPEHRLAMGSFGSTVLILKPVPAWTPPAASFPCARAATSSEKAICGSRELASLDRSVAVSFSDDLRQFAAIDDPAASARLKVTQRDWLGARDRCGADDACLRKAMETRLQALAEAGS